LHPEAVSWASIVWGRLGQDDNTLAGMPVKMSLEHMQWASGPGDRETQDATAPANKASDLIQLEFIVSEQLEELSCVVAILLMLAQAAKLAGSVSTSNLEHIHLC
jgi:hypothetical protein